MTVTPEIQSRLDQMRETPEFKRRKESLKLGVDLFAEGTPAPPPARRAAAAAPPEAPALEVAAEEPVEGTVVAFGGSLEGQPTIASPTLLPLLMFFLTPS